MRLPSAWGRAVAGLLESGAEEGGACVSGAEVAAGAEARLRTSSAAPGAGGGALGALASALLPGLPSSLLLVTLQHMQQGARRRRQ